MVNLDLYKVFYTVAKCGSLTKAAEKLYISQPAVSQAIKQLEIQLGVSLFNRTRRGMELSAQGGEVIFKKIEEGLKLFSDAEDMINQRKNTATGEIRVGASDTIFEYFLADKIVEFHEKVPAVKINLISDITPNTVEDLKSGKCDVGFVNLPIEQDDGLKLYGNCMQLNDVFVAGEKFSELKDKSSSFEELKNYPLIVLEKKTAARQALDRYVQTLGVTLEPSIEVGSWDLMKRLVSRGMGIGVIPREYIQDKLQTGEVFEVKTEPCLPTRSVGMILLKDQSIPFALREFLSLFGFDV